VRSCDRGNDREAQPGAGSIAGSTAEPLERARYEIRRKPLTLVDDMQFEGAVVFGGFEPHGSSAVAQGVLDEVAERLLEPPPVGEHLGPRRNNDLDLSTRIVSAAAEAGRNRVEQLSDHNARSAKRQRPGVDASEEQKVVGELREPVGFITGTASRRTWSPSSVPAKKRWPWSALLS